MQLLNHIYDKMLKSRKDSMLEGVEEVEEVYKDLDQEKT